MASVQEVLSALDVFNGAPDKALLKQVNTWLQDFQHSVNTLLYLRGRFSTSDSTRFCSSTSAMHGQLAMSCC